MRMSRRKEKQQFYMARKYTLALLAVIFITGIAVSQSSISAKAGDHPMKDTSTRTVMQDRGYKSILLKPGDTLWEIALEYNGFCHSSVQDYIDEVMEINGLTSDRIHAGRYLTIPYCE